MKSTALTMERGLEIVVGLVLAVAALVPLVVSIGLPLTTSNADDWWWSAPAALVAALVAVWCIQTSWRLITGRPRSDGGLLSPWLIAGIGVALTAGVLYELWEFGVQRTGHAFYRGALAASCFELARRRFQSARARQPMKPSLD